MIDATMGCHRWFLRSSKKGFDISLWLLQTLLLVDISLAMKCEEGYYLTTKEDQLMCVRCTEACSAMNHRVEVLPCSNHTNRECHCVQGTYCSILNQYSCRRCLPCEQGTFMNITSRDSHCKPYTNCAMLGMVTIREGSNTTDNVCGPKTTHSPTTASKSPVKAPQYKNSTPGAVTRDPPYFTDTSSINTQSSLKDTDSTQYLWLVLFVLLFSALLLAFIRWKGAKRVHEYWRHSLSRHVKDGMSPKEELELSPGGPQQITVGHNGGGNCVSNNMGEIHIYNPKMVVLGSNSLAQKEESRRAEEQLPLIGTPQQESLTGGWVPDGTELGSEESGSSSPSLVECTEDDCQKELSYPVPATGK